MHYFAIFTIEVPCLFIEYKLARNVSFCRRRHTRCAFTRRGDKISYKVNVAPHFRRAQASAFTRICGATNSLELKYFNFDTNFA